MACSVLWAPPATCAQAPATPRAVIQTPRPGTPQPPRDTSARPTAPTPPVVGTAMISGRIVSADTGEPLRRATVSATSTRPPEPPANGRFVPPRPYSARTDDDGRFTIRELPAGEYNVVARRAGYVDQSFGQTTPSTPSRRVHVADGAAVGPLAFRLVRGGVVTGRVIDEQGEPAERVQVRTVRAQRIGGQTRWVGFSMGDMTDDQGHYRLFGLAPGEYLVVAEPGGMRFGMGSQNLQGVDTDTIPTYGPGTVNPAEAMKVTVQPGVEAAMDIQLVAAKVATVRGRILTSKGEPLGGGFVNLQAEGEFSGMGKGGPVMGDGRFEIDGVAPGTYTLFAQDMSRSGFMDDGPAPDAAAQTVTVQGEDVDITVNLTAGSTARGRVIVEGGDAAAIASRSLRLMSFPVDAVGMRTMPGRGKVAEDLTFEMTGLRGQQIITAQTLPEGYWLKDVRVSGQPALDGFDFGSNRTFTNLEVVISGRPTGLSGTVTLPTGGAAGDYAVVLFPQDEARWERGTMGGTGPRAVRPGLDGTFKIPALRPGSYYVLALPAEQADLQVLSEPEQLRMLAGRARTVEVQDGQTATVTLTLVER